MPITIIDILGQQNRQANVGLSSFFHLVNSADVNFKINGIQEDATLNPSLTEDVKYIVKDVANLHANFAGVTAIASNDDIVRRNASSWELFVDVSNPKTNGGILVYNIEDGLLYYYGGISGSQEWKVVGTGSGGTAGGIGTTGATGATGPTGPVGDYVISVNGSTGPVTLTFQGSTGEIEIIGSGNSYTIGLPNDVTIGGTLNISGNLNISGYVISDGVIISKTGFSGYTFDTDLEFVSDISLDGGDF